MIKTIKATGNYKMQFKRAGLCYPRLKSTGKYGLDGSILLDRSTEEESVKATLKYLEDKEIIQII